MSSFTIHRAYDTLDGSRKRITFELYSKDKVLKESNKLISNKRSKYAWEIAESGDEFYHQCNNE